MGTTGGENASSNGLPSDADLAALANLIAAEPPSEEHADRDLSELLAQLENADVLAQQMENNIDRLLERLDGMVEGLEAAQTSQKEAANDVSSNERTVDEDRTTGVIEKQKDLPK